MFLVWGLSLAVFLSGGGFRRTQTKRNMTIFVQELQFTQASDEEFVSSGSYKATKSIEITLLESNAAGPHVGGLPLRWAHSYEKRPRKASIDVPYQSVGVFF